MSEAQQPELILNLESADFFNIPLAEKAQHILEDQWQYKREACPNKKDEFVAKINNYQAKALISKADSFDSRSNRCIALWRLAQKGDFVVLTDLQYRGSERVNHARRNGFHFTFYHYLMIVYYPATDMIDFEKYHSS